MMGIANFQHYLWRSTLTLGGCLMLVLASNGCSKDEATETMRQAGESASETATKISEDAGAAVEKGKETASVVADDAGQAIEKGKQMAGELGEKAMAFLTPLKEKFGDLDELKDSPEKLKLAVNDLVETIEEKAEGVKLPESISNALATVKEKLVGLGEYLEGEVEDAKIDEKLREIKESAGKLFAKPKS